MKKTVIVLAVLVVGYLLMQAGRADYLAFDQRREDWHRRCDNYVGSRAIHLSNAERTATCERELNELVAYAQQKGWAR